MNKLAQVKAAISPLVQVLISCFFRIVTFSNTDQIKKESIITLLNCHMLPFIGNSKEVMNAGNQWYILRTKKESKKITIILQVFHTLSFKSFLFINTTFLLV